MNLNSERRMAQNNNNYMAEEEQGDRRVSVYYTNSQNDEGDSSSHRVIDLNQIDLGAESGGTPGLNSYRANFVKIGSNHNMNQEQLELY